MRPAIANAAAAPAVDPSQDSEVVTGRAGQSMVDGLFAAGLPATRERSRKTRKERSE
jgi:hypothetical protein